jgi:hypothetical protein
VDTQKFEFIIEKKMKKVYMEEEQIKLNFHELTKSWYSCIPGPHTPANPQTEMNFRAVFTGFHSHLDLFQHSFWHNIYPALAFSV